MITYFFEGGGEGVCSKEETVVTLSSKWGEHWYQKLWEIMRQVLKCLGQCLEHSAMPSVASIYGGPATCQGLFKDFLVR